MQKEIRNRMISIRDKIVADKVQARKSLWEKKERRLAEGP